MPTTEFYHGTSLEAALAIQKEGFRTELSGSNAGAALGNGLYVTTTLEKAMNYAKGKNGEQACQGLIFRLKVDLGRCYEVKNKDPMRTTWGDNGFDSAWAKAGVIGVREENCIKDPARRVTITDVILGNTQMARTAGYSVRNGRLVHSSERIATPARNRSPSSALASQGTWWVSREGGSKGPYTEADIAKSIRDANVTSTCRLCNTAHDKSVWSQASNWSQFENALSHQRTWWVSRKTGNKGPYTVDDISKYIQDGTITSTCLLCNTAHDKSVWSETSTWGTPKFQNVLSHQKTWWVSRKSGNQGPYTEADISKYVQAGTITSTCQLCNTAHDKTVWSETGNWPQFQ